MSRRSGWVWVGQILLATVVALFVWRALADHWQQFRRLEFPLRLQPGWIILAALLIWLAYGGLIAAWRAVLLGWGESLPFVAAARIWCVSNLGRYLPGKVWSLAGLAVLAQKAGVSGTPAAASALAMQALAVGTGVLVATMAAISPHSASLATYAATALVAFGSVAALTARPVLALVAHVTRGKIDLEPLPAWTAAAAATVTFVAWLLYGVAFWLLARGLMPGYEPGLTTAIGGFAAGYIVGLLALFAPGGLGVREAVLVALFTPSIGPGPAIALTVGSRLLWTVTEVLAALTSLALGNGKRGDEV